MKTYRLGTTDIQASQIGFGGLPIQRVSEAEAVRLVRRAAEGGITLFDTAYGYTDSEEKLGIALSDVRKGICIATKVSGAQTGEEATERLNTSLRRLQTEYVDIIQFHFAKRVFCPGDEDGMYDAMLRAKEQGKARYIGITTHRLDVAVDAAKSGLYSTVQFPLSYLSSPEELELIEICRTHGVGLLAMKGLAGGLLRNAAAVHAFFQEHEAGCRPLYGIQYPHELEEFLGYVENPVNYAEVADTIACDRKELSGEFCRACGYCMPCPAGIEINVAMRVNVLLRRAPVAGFMEQESFDMMQKTKECTGCGQCHTRCPYELDPPSVFPKQREEYMKTYAAYWAARK